VVSHDILSNLDLMLSAGKILVGKQPKKESLTQYYDIAQRTSRQLKDYCLGLLEEARSAVGTVSRVSEPMQVLEAILARQEIALLSKGCRVQLEPLAPSTLPESIVEQVFQNLISNALRYGMGAENPTLRIAEENDPLRGTTRWVVEDNGAGIPLERREGIFQGSAHQEDQSQGQHLGLSLLRDTLQSYGAKIWVEERRGGGTRFVVDLGMQGELQG
jgi:signal transduction histidine kinase